jgi:hypothetical protein
MNSYIVVPFISDLFVHIGFIRQFPAVGFPRQYRFWQNNGNFTKVAVCSGAGCSLVRAT